MKLRSPADESGLTLIELLVATAMTIIITGAAVALLISALHKQQNVTARSDNIGVARNAIEKLTVDLRQGRKVTVAKPAEVTLETYCDNSSTGISEKCTVVVVCAVEVTGGSTYKCTRKVGTAAAVTVITGLASASVFCFVPSTVSGNESECGTKKTGTETTYVGVEAKLLARGGGTTVLQDGGALHNLGL